VDDHGFDDLTRALATGASRRRVLSGIAGTAVAAIFGTTRFGNAAAQQATVVPGGVCTVNTDCSQPAGGTVVCGNNGYDSDGALNCCRNEGGSCNPVLSSHDCCGATLCVGGMCTTGGSTGGGVALGGVCSQTSQCGQPTGGAVVCASNGIAGDGALNCCRNNGGACTDGTQCCGSLLCTGGVCGGSSSGSGLAPGEPCTATSQCLQTTTGGAVICADNGYSSDGALNCCRNEGGVCNSGGDSSDCCSGLYCIAGVCGGSSSGASLPPGSACVTTSQCLQSATGGAVVCADNGYSFDGALNCCRNEGGVCIAGGDSADCCAGLLCVGGICGGTSSGGSLTLGATCSATSQCSQPSGGAVVCASNGIAGDGALNCCRNNGGACTDGTQCCGSLLCTGGVCGGTATGSGLVPGDICTATSECSQTGGTTSCSDNGISGDGTLNCCRPAGGSCTDGSGCCGGLACDSNGLPGDGALNCCNYTGGICAVDAHCCAALLCVSGRCQ